MTVALTRSRLLILLPSLVLLLVPGGARSATRASCGEGECAAEPRGPSKDSVLLQLTAPEARRAAAGGPPAAGHLALPPAVSLLLAEQDRRTRGRSARSLSQGLQLHAKSLAAAHLARAAGVNESAGWGEGAQAELIQGLLDTIDEGLTTGMMQDFAEDQAEVDDQLQRIVQCGRDMADANSSSTAHGVAAAAAGELAACESTAANLSSARAATCAGAHALLAGLASHPDCSLANDTSAGALAAFVECLEERAAELPGAREAHGQCSNATAAHEGQAQVCQAKEHAHHEALCALRAFAEATCQAYGACHAREAEHYAGVVARVRRVEEGRQTEAVALVRSRCYLAIVQANATTLAGAEGQALLSTCEHLTMENLTTNMSNFTIAYPPAPNASACQLVTPGDGGASVDCEAVAEARLRLPYTGLSPLPANASLQTSPRFELSGHHIIVGAADGIARLSGSSVLVCTVSHAGAEIPGNVCFVVSEAGGELSESTPPVPGSLDEWIFVERLGHNKALKFGRYGWCEVVVSEGATLTYRPKVELLPATTRAVFMEPLENDRMAVCYDNGIKWNEHHEIRCGFLTDADGALSYSHEVLIEGDIPHAWAEPRIKRLTDSRAMLCYSRAQGQSPETTAHCRLLAISADGMAKLGGSVDLSADVALGHTKGDVAVLTPEKVLVCDFRACVVVSAAGPDAARGGALALQPTQGHVRRHSVLATLWDDRAVLCWVEVPHGKSIGTPYCAVAVVQGMTVALGGAFPMAGDKQVLSYKVSATALGRGRVLACYEDRVYFWPEAERGGQRDGCVLLHYAGAGA